MKNTTAVKKPTWNEILKGAGNLPVSEMEMAYEAFDLGRGFRGEMYGISAAFAAGMIYATRLEREKKKKDLETAPKGV